MKKLLLFSLLVLSLFTTAAYAQRKGHFEIVKTEQGKYYFVLKSSNGQEILKGFQYGSEDKAREAAGKTRGLAMDEANFDQRSRGEQWYFFLKSSDGRAVAQSEYYTTEAAMKRGIESVKKTAPEAAVLAPDN
ncbi:MAG TPA: YegP family protein [Pyrinomonadaceae bacterium]|jgi:uncharacterized protein YegP (UPF0339 family)|nr:YegP family protein [Pyrinomonadaceae bacterium]